MKNYFLVLFALCCATQTMCSTENIVPKSHDSEDRERTSLIKQSCSSKYFNIPHKDRIPAQHGIPTLHEIAFKKLEPAITETISYNLYDKKDDKQRKIDFAELIAAHSPHALKAFINTPRNSSDRTTWLEYSTLLGKPLEIIIYLLKAGADPNSQGNQGPTPLHRAAQSNCYTAIPLLIASGANVNGQDKYKQTPLYDAVLNNSGEAIALLINAGADVNQQDVFGKSPRMLINCPATLQIFDQAVATRQPTEEAASRKRKAIDQNFIARKK
ncbi:MAG: ankyrin repeat domain-containing protein [Candidatus Chromulinivorax sp.]|nr:ankyrin repeat domain-containing protein [Candidatus Chromulinivorax sp.]